MAGIITNVFSAGCCNVAFISPDPARADNYGRQIERASSHPRMTQGRGARGNSWHYPEERDSPPSMHDLYPQSYPPGPSVHKPVA